LPAECRVVLNGGKAPVAKAALPAAAPVPAATAQPEIDVSAKAVAKQ
jgi:hypothetical protein